MSDFIKTIQETIQSIYKMREALTGSLAVDEAIKIHSMLAWVRQKESDARAVYYATLWTKLEEKEDGKPISYAKAEAYAKAQPDYHDFLRMGSLGETLLEIGYDLRQKGKDSDKELKAQVWMKN